MKTLALFAAVALSTTSLLASADVVTVMSTTQTVIRAGLPSQLFFSVQNNGPDTATGVTVAVSTSSSYTCDCPSGDIPSGQNRIGTISFIAPAANTTLPISVTATSSVP
ncbi:MAG TPA: hypothetical protein VHX14_11100, partial [Thermoanaerobaculia bacterium]|nr:hypothetical protein [Thermoanaerobaculia bacterium]